MSMNSHDNQHKSPHGPAGPGDSATKNRGRRRRKRSGRPANNQRVGASPAADLDAGDLDSADLDSGDLDDESDLTLPSYGKSFQRETTPSDSRVAQKPARPAAKPPAAARPPAKPQAAARTPQHPPRPQAAPQTKRPAAQSTTPAKPHSDRPRSHAAATPPAVREEEPTAASAPPRRGRPHTDKPNAEKPRTEKPNTEKDRAERPRTETARTEHKRPPAENTREKTRERPPRETELQEQPPRERPGHEKPAREKTVERPRPAAPRSQKAHSAEFAELGLSPVMLDALAEACYESPTPVQKGFIPRALAGVDVMGQAQTGTGKTAAFAIPILEMLQPHQRGAPPQALALVPTRELAVQVRDECEKLALGRHHAIVAVYGGKPIRKQIEQVAAGASFIVGTPGRVLDLMSRGALTWNSLRVVVLDEADRMLDIGFRPDIEKILRRCPQGRQTLLLSATLAPPVKKLAERYMREPEVLDFSPTNLSVETIEQFYFTVDPERKFDLLVKLLEREDPKQAIVFCRTKRGTEKIHMEARAEGHLEHVDTIHGDLQQSSRDRVMKGFRDGKIRWLVATDVVGRGIDVSGISHIINFDIPQFCDDYVHRVGRTGRMGREGVAYTFVSPEEGGELTRIEMRINRLLKRDEVPGFQAFDDPRAAGGVVLGDGPGYNEDDYVESPKPAPLPVFGKRAPRRTRRAL